MATTAVPLTTRVGMMSCIASIDPDPWSGVTRKSTEEAAYVRTSEHSASTLTYHLFGPNLREDVNNRRFVLYSRRSSL